MIRAVIFDMGNVLLDFDPDAAVRRLPVDPTAQQFIKELLLASPEWVAFDRGDLTEEAVLRQLSARAPAELRGALKECLHTWHETMVPLPGAAEAVRMLNEAGFAPHWINRNAPEGIRRMGHDSRKIFADVYIDDKAMR